MTYKFLDKRLYGQGFLDQSTHKKQVTDLILLCFGLVPWKPLFFEMSSSIHVFVFSLQYFSFTLFTMALNEITQENASQISPTDSRLRPDIRLLEQGQIGNRKDKCCEDPERHLSIISLICCVFSVADLASAEKNRLEEKQRAARKERKKRKEEWSPL